MTTFAPSATSRRALAPPMLRAPPLIRATLPSTRPMVVPSDFYWIGSALAGERGGEDSAGGAERQIERRTQARRCRDDIGNGVDEATGCRRDCRIVVVAPGAGGADVDPVRRFTHDLHAIGATL